MDSLTAHYLARELDARWRGRRVAGFEIDRERRAVALLVAGGPAVEIDFSASEVRVYERAQPPARGTLDGWSVAAVTAPVDDRRVTIQFEKPGKFRGSPSRHATLEVSMVPAARGATLRTDGGRALASVGAKLPRPVDPRPLLEAQELRDAARRSDRDELLRGRWVSPLIAEWLLVEPESIVERYAEIAALPPARPSRCGERVLPLPFCSYPVSVASLIAGEPREKPPWRARGGGQRERALERMRGELERAQRAPLLREAAGALMSLGDVPCPLSVPLPGGASVATAPQPGETARAAAERMYGIARSMERALARLPARIAELESGPEPAPRPRVRRRRDAPPARRPFRTYRSSGGLDIWVGRGAASNDALTFAEAAPSDVWLHARSASGAHVVLRWQREESPPARDLEEAAQLAAWHSKARGSTVVPVDWTRKKYVRKPRGGAPGLAIVSRSQTIFVRPSAEVERRLRTTG